MKNIGKLYVFILSGMLLVGCGKQTQSYLEVTQESEEHFETEEADTQTVQAKEEDGHILIYVCGEVNFPGVYELPAGSRIVDAVDAADPHPASIVIAIPAARNFFVSNMLFFTPFYLVRVKNKKQR